MKQKIAIFLILAGALLILGAAGDSDTGRIPIEWVLMKIAAGIILFGAGFILRKTSEVHIDE